MGAGYIKFTDGPAGLEIEAVTKGDPDANSAAHKALFVVVTALPAVLGAAVEQVSHSQEVK
jgi:hypothetical protein